MVDLRTLNPDFYGLRKFREKEARKKRKAEKKIAHAAQVSENKDNRKLKTVRNSHRRLIARVERMCRHPSRLNATRLLAIARDRDAPSAARSLAAATVLRWGTIGPRSEPKRQSHARRRPES